MSALPIDHKSRPVRNYPNLALLPHHEALLLRSVISPVVADGRGYRSAQAKDDLNRLGFPPNQQRVPALVIPVWSVSRPSVAFYQARPGAPRVNQSGKPIKYETPRNVCMALDCHPLIRSQLQNPSVPLWITEGIRKADALVSAGVCCVSLLGVWNWRGKNEHGGKTALPDWDTIALNGRTAYVVFDSDVMVKSEVQNALERLAAFLTARGANVLFVYLPAAASGAKVGVDDYLAAGHSVDDLTALAVNKLRRGHNSETTSASAIDNHGEESRLSQSTQLVKLARARTELFHTPDGIAYATLEMGGHRETWSLRSHSFRRWLAREFYLRHGKTPSSQAIADALGVLEGDAVFGGPEIPVFIRLAEHEGAIYLDLADRDWRAVEITPDGWRVVTNPPVRFRRARGVAPLPEPMRAGSIEKLRQFINIATEEDWTLIIGWTVSALRPTGPFPVLALHGEQGSAKSTTARVLRALVDPNTTSLRSEPRDLRDVMIAANNGWAQVFDNLSHLPQWLSDAFCRLSTGGGFATRQLYEDVEEILFEQARPHILGALLDGVVAGLRNVANKGQKDGTTFFGDRTAALLTAWMAAHPNPHPATPVCCRGDGTMLGPSTITHILHRLSKRAGLPQKISPHALRHYAATSLLRRTGDLELVRRVLRHESLAMTLRYARLTQTEVADKFLHASPLEHLDGTASRRLNTAGAVVSIRQQTNLAGGDRRTG